MTLIAIRAVEAADTPQIAGLLSRLFPADPNRPTDRELGERAKSGCPYLLVAADFDRIAGFAVLRDRPVRCWTDIDFIGVDHDYEGRGLGTILIRHLRSAVHRPLVGSTVRSSNTRARRLFIRSGFSMLGRHMATTTNAEDRLIMMAERIRTPPPQTTSDI